MLIGNQCLSLRRLNKRIYLLLISLFLYTTVFAQAPTNKYAIGATILPQLSNTSYDTTGNTSSDILQFQYIKNCKIDFVYGSYYYNNLDDSQDFNDYGLYLASKTGLDFLVTDYRATVDGQDSYSSTLASQVVSWYTNSISTSERNAMMGYFVKDEPQPNSNDLAQTQSWLGYLHQNDAQKLTLIYKLLSVLWTSAPLNTGSRHRYIFLYYTKNPFRLVMNLRVLLSQKIVLFVPIPAHLHLKPGSIIEKIERAGKPCLIS